MLILYLRSLLPKVCVQYNMMNETSISNKNATPIMYFHSLPPLSKAKPLPITEKEERLRERKGRYQFMY
jgi:hypothetical protein